MRIGWPVAVLAWLVVSLVTGFATLGATDVVRMEGLLADGARYMARTGELAVPRVYGEIYAFKPPLAYWLTAVSFELFGESELSLRLPFALCGAVPGLAVLVLVGRRVGPRAGLVCALATSTGLLALEKTALAEFDAPLAAGVAVAIAAACENLLAARARVGVWLLGYAGLAFAFLAKGSPALLLYAPGLAIAAWRARKWSRLLSPGHLLGVAAFAGAVATWVAAAWRAEGPAAFEQPVAEALERGFNWDLEAIGLVLLKPLLLATLFLPWSLAPFGGLRDGTDGAPRARELQRVALAFVAAGVLLFCAMPTWEPRYALPLAAPIGVYCGLALEEDRAQRAWSARLRSAVVALFGLAAAGFAVFAGSSVGWLARATLVGIAAATLSLGLRTSAPRSPLPWVLAALCAWGVQALALRPRQASTRSLREAAATFDPFLESDETVWSELRDRHSSLFFYLARPTGTVDLDAPRWPPGAAIVLTGRQLEAFPRAVPHVVASSSGRRHDLSLVRVPEGDAGL